ncbi:hypothetical protein [Deinococcus petrolearius]|uniref:Uncharacterized protein n=1 Tax=Deinococcus petrolearius TaxID=1751295 RepID=A0ABW1DIQ2_9DEIO
MALRFDAATPAESIRSGLLANRSLHLSGTAGPAILNTRASLASTFTCSGTGQSGVARADPTGSRWSVTTLSAAWPAGDSSAGTPALPQRPASPPSCRSSVAGSRVGSWQARSTHT